jgi:hypothetical protein
MTFPTIRSLIASPSLLLPFHHLISRFFLPCQAPLAVGDLVFWKSADDEVPPGTVGRISCCFPDGDVEVAFPRLPGHGGDNAKNLEPLVFAFRPDRLVKLTVNGWQRAIVRKKRKQEERVTKEA